MKYNYLSVRVNSQQKPSFFTGPTLRGTLGHVLKEKVCISPAYDCSTCLYQKECLYYEYYESSAGYRALRLDVRLEAKNYDFGFYFFGDTQVILRTMIQSVRDMLQTGTISDKKLSFPQSEIFLNGEKLFFSEKGMLKPFKFSPQSLIISKYHRNVTIKFLTPCLIKEYGKLKKEISLEDVLLSIYKRKTYFESKAIVRKLNYIPSYTLASSHLHKVTTNRKSDRQNKAITLEGVTGDMHIENLDPESYSLLRYGEILSVGNKTVFGYGIIKLINKI